MSCGCNDRDGPRQDRDAPGEIIANTVMISESYFYSDPEWDEFLGCVECDAVGVGFEILHMSGSSDCVYAFKAEQSDDGRVWHVTDTLWSDSLEIGLRSFREGGFVPRMRYARIRGEFLSGTTPGQLFVTARATRQLKAGAGKVCEENAKVLMREAIRSLPESEDPEALARRLVAASLMAQPKVMEALRELARQTLAEERAALAMAERRSPQPRLVLDKILNSSIVTALSECEHELFLGDYDRLALFVEAVPTALTGLPTITIDRLASLDGRSFFTAQTLNAGVSLPAAGLFLHTGSVSPGAGRGRISVTISAGGGSWTGRIRIWATPWFEEEEAAEHLAVGRARGVYPGHRTTTRSGSDVRNHNSGRDPLNEERRST